MRRQGRGSSCGGAVAAVVGVVLWSLDICSRAHGCLPCLVLDSYCVRFIASVACRSTVARRLATRIVRSPPARVPRDPSRWLRVSSRRLLGRGRCTLSVRVVVSLLVVPFRRTRGYKKLFFSVHPVWHGRPRCCSQRRGQLRCLLRAAAAHCGRAAAPVGPAAVWTRRWWCVRRARAPWACVRAPSVRARRACSISPALTAARPPTTSVRRFPCRLCAAERSGAAASAVGLVVPLRAARTRSGRAVSRGVLAAVPRPRGSASAVLPCRTYGSSIYLIRFN